MCARVPLEAVPLAQARQGTLRPLMAACERGTCLHSTAAQPKRIAYLGCVTLVVSFSCSDVDRQGVRQVSVRQVWEGGADLAG